MKDSIYPFRVKNAQNQEISLETYKGKVLMIVNTASKCGFTPQFADLEKLYNEFNDKGFEILGFPSNDFAGQEPNNAEAAQSFCQLNYGVTFPIMEKIHVKKRAEQHPLFKFLGDNAPGANLITHPKWNFQKYLINKNGEVVDFFLSTTNPDSEKVKSKIKALLKA